MTRSSVGRVSLAPSFGDVSMPLNVPNRPVTREDNSSVEACLARSRQILQAVLDRSELPRKAIAADVLGRDDEPQFSKMVGGVRPWDLDHIDTLPRPVRIEWLRKRCEAEGLEVRDPDVLEAACRLMEAFEQFTAAMKVMRLPAFADHMAKAQAEYRGQERRRA